MALLAATVTVIWDSLTLSVATAGRRDPSISILVQTKVEKFAKPALENIFFVQESATKEPLLKMVIIRTTSSRGIKQLRGMHLDIVRVRPDPDRAPGDKLFSGGYVVEAVVTKGELAKLKAMGFEVSEIPEKN